MAIDIKEILANGLLDLCHKKDLSQITVKDLLETTGVSRQTFYNHFLDKNDLIQYIYNYKIINRFNGQNTNLDFYESLIESFEHMKQYQTFLKQACLMDGQNCLKEYISKHCEEFDLKWHQQLYGEVTNARRLKICNDISCECFKCNDFVMDFVGYESPCGRNGKNDYPNARDWNG